MNRYSRYKYALIAAFLLAGCQRDKTTLIPEDEFPHTKVLNSQEIDFGKNRYDVFYTIDSVMIAYNALSDDVFLDAYKLPSLDYLGAIARKGRGPGEFLHAEYENNNYYYEDDELKILVFDQLRNYACVVNLSQTIEQQRTVIEQEMKFTYTISGLYLKDKHTLLLRGHDIELFYLYDSTRNEYREIDPDLYTTDWKQLHKYNHILALFPGDKSKAVLNYRSMNRISVQELSENAITVQDGPYSIFSRSLPLDQTASEDMTKVIYNDIRILNNDIYCLYMNQTLDEMYEAPKPVEIHLFDKHLNPVARYSIGEGIRFIAVDNINKTIYGVTADDEYYRYILP